MKEMLDYFSSKYYAGEPVISDEEFDKLADYYNYESVGATVQGNSVAHAFPMWSLQKVYDDEEMINLPGSIVITPKLDGAAIALYYTYGNLSLALTRGDGKAGLDITDKIKTLVISRIKEWFSWPLIQVVGEVVAPNHIENSRNYSAGALNLKSVEEFKTRDLNFFAYGVNPRLNSFWDTDMAELDSVGFNTVITDDTSNFPTDGLVYRLNDYNKFEELGYTSKHPRGAFALKERKGGVVTKLLDVEWQLGRSGVVSPVAILEPVKIGDATITKATLHNYKYIQELDLDYNCLVEVVRSGEIIPRVVRRIYE